MMRERRVTAEVVASAFRTQSWIVVGEKSLAPREQQLYTLRGGDGLLLTTVKWASASGNLFWVKTAPTLAWRLRWK